MKSILCAVLTGIVVCFHCSQPAPVIGATIQPHPASAPFVKTVANSTLPSQDPSGNAQPVTVAGEERPVKRHFFSLAVGAVYWPSLGEVDPSQAGFNPQQFGQFEVWGLNIELAYHYFAATWLGKDLWIGVDFGLFFNENTGKTEALFLPSGETIEGNIGSRGLYLTPSIKWFVWGAKGPRLYLGAGIGYYLLDFAELYPFGEGGEIYEASALGGYIGVGVRLPIRKNNPESFALVLESKVHFADFGEFATNTGGIQGPIYLFQLGMTF